MFSAFLQVLGDICKITNLLLIAVPDDYLKSSQRSNFVQTHTQTDRLTDSHRETDSQTHVPIQGKSRALNIGFMDI